MEWDDDGLDDGPGSPLLPPDDRLWRHPSEVAEAIPTTVRGHAAAPAGTPRVVTIVALTSCISVLITLGVVAVARPVRTRAEFSPTQTPSGGLASVGDVAALTAQVRPAIGHVQAMGAGEDGRDSLGSGVIFRSDGMMLTAHHVVDGASAVRVVLDDGRSVRARLVGGDEDTDIALLDLEGDSFPVAELAADDRSPGGTVVGQPAITIGASPAGGSSVSPVVRTTMVSAIGQEAGIEGRKLVDMIRTDSAMAAGCSGGALVDRTGRVIAIAASNVSTEDGETIGFATPISVATAVAEQLMVSGRVVRGWLGVDGASRNGAYVHNVRADSPAAAAGIVAGDVITAIDGSGVASMSALAGRLRSRKPGDTVRLSVVRGASTLEVRATLGERPDN
ncbi:MAG TPA: trypsin-like peptidase domain-containing protein [Acidimicrobiales bacterium]|nr:trypsin-like peptidase domain-containing protein [Acidimicrobiales bacterium]